MKVEDVRAAEAKAKAAGKTAEIVICPGAPHGFHADDRPGYQKDAAEDGWKHRLAWFADRASGPDRTSLMGRNDL